MERDLFQENHNTMGKAAASCGPQENCSLLNTDLETSGSGRFNNENVHEKFNSSSSDDDKDSIPLQSQSVSYVSKDTVSKILKGSAKRKKARSDIKKIDYRIINESFQQMHGVDNVTIKEEHMVSENTSDTLETVTVNNLDGFVQSMDSLCDNEVNRMLVTSNDEFPMVKGDNNGFTNFNNETAQNCYYDVSARKRRKMKGNVKNFCCAHCPFTSPRWDRLKEHLIVHLEERPFSCDICGFKAKTAKTLKRHKDNHSRERIFQCPKCPVSYKRKHSLKEHLKDHLKEQVFECSVCDFSTTRSQYLKRHMIKHMGAKLHCYVCNYETVYSSKLKRHLEGHAGTPRTQYHCSKCDYSSVHRQCVRQHEKTHDKETVYQCGICEFTAGTSETLRTHMQMHLNGGNRYKCEKCTYETMRKRDLKRHCLRVHNEDKNIS